MSVVLCTLALNEMQWLPKLYEQHKDWPGLLRWVFVEAADQVYAQVNPELVTPDGLSTDGTSAFLRELASVDKRVTYIPHGYSKNADPAKGKCAARDKYLEVVNGEEPEFFCTLDADEFYTKEHQNRVFEVFKEYPQCGGYIIPKREIWHPPYLQRQGEPLFAYEVVKGFWGIPCCHWWRWEPGVAYRECHNTPTRLNGTPLNSNALDVRDLNGTVPNLPQLIHMGFAASVRCRLAKNHYYETRGEKTDGCRAWYTKSRAAWKDWRPGVPLPREAEVVEYGGPVPEVFQ